MQAPPEVQIDHFCFQCLLSEAEIENKVEAISQALGADFFDKRPLFIIMLQGAFIYAADLVRRFPYPCDISFVKIQTYAGMESNQELTIQLPPDEKITGRHVILVEDIIDTGNTLFHFIPQLEALQPASIHITSILFKPDALLWPLPLNMAYIGFHIPEAFVIGYGLDYNQQGRNLPAIYQLKP